MIMEPIVSEIIIPCSDNDGRTIFNPARIIIRVDDNGSGPYLKIRGEDDNPETTTDASCFYLCTAEEIDKFSSICKKMLAEAEE